LRFHNEKYPLIVSNAKSGSKTSTLSPSKTSSNVSPSKTSSNESETVDEQIPKEDSVKILQLQHENTKVLNIHEELMGLWGYNPKPDFKKKKAFEKKKFKTFNFT